MCVCVNNNVPFNLSVDGEFLMSVNSAQHGHTHTVTPCKHGPCNANALLFQCCAAAVSQPTIANALWQESRAATKTNCEYMQTVEERRKRDREV